MRMTQPAISDFEGKEEATSQGMWAASRIWEREAHTFFPEPQERNIALPYLDFSPLRPLELEYNKFVMFKATRFVVICYISSRKLR